jgi:hypothetical protein
MSEKCDESAMYEGVVIEGRAGWWYVKHDEGYAGMGGLESGIGPSDGKSCLKG